MSDGRNPADLPGSGQSLGVTELLVMRCTRCGHVSWPPRLLCPACGATDFEQVVAGPGVVRQRTDTQTPTGEPVALATVLLDAGPWVVARVADAAPGDRVMLLLTDTDAVEAVL
jgi:uncharacterized OB-fold protein